MLKGTAVSWFRESAFPRWRQIDPAFQPDYQHWLARMEALRGAAWVCARIPAKERRSDVPYTLHREVASFESVPRGTLLKQAADEEWTRGELRSHIQRLKHADKRALPVPSHTASQHYSARAKAALSVTFELRHYGTP